MARNRAEVQLNRICKKFGVSDVYELAQLHLKHDQESVQQEVYDLEDLSFTQNKIKEALLKIDIAMLETREQRVVKSILWLWYHHATTIAVWQKNDIQLAIHYCDLALSYLYPEHPNKITPMLYMLLHNRLRHAQRWAEDQVGDNERAYAEHLIAEYKKGTFKEKPQAP